MKSELTRISQKFKKAQMGLKDALAVIDMTLEDHLQETSTMFPYEIFEGLDDLTNRTVHGTKIERFRPKKNSQPFHTFEIHTEDGEEKAEIRGEKEIIWNLPEKLKKEPTLFIERLPVYRRPYLISWMEKKGSNPSLNLQISDLLELGFDPTKLREFHHGGWIIYLKGYLPGSFPPLKKRPGSC
ncbi:MAG: hypothetical protein ACUVWO_17905 [Thermodesulfobacteriota bacterium]